MFRRLSWVRRASVALVLLGSLCAGLLGQPHVEGDDDFACAPIPVAHDENAHYVGGVTPPAHADGHCFLCHSLRSFYPALDAVRHTHQTPDRERLHAARIDPAASAQWTIVPGRAPPA